MQCVNGVHLTAYSYYLQYYVYKCMYMHVRPIQRPLCVLLNVFFWMKKDRKILVRIEIIYVFTFECYYLLTRKLIGLNLRRCCVYIHLYVYIVFGYINYLFVYYILYILIYFERFIIISYVSIIYSYQYIKLNVFTNVFCTLNI